MIALYATGGLLAAAFVTDIRQRKIPNWLTIPSVVLGLVYYSVQLGWEGLLLASTGLLTGFLPMLLLYMLRAVGAGDVKLFAALGAFVGAVNTAQILFASLMFAGLIALLLLCWRGELLTRGRRLLFSLFRIGMLHDKEEISQVIKAEGYLRFPFMWAVAPGAIISYWQWT